MKCRCNELNEIDGWEADDYAKGHLNKIRVSNWEIEFECPETGIQWIMDFPHGELQGGGPPHLKKVQN